MPDVLSETKNPPTNDQGALPLHDDLWSSGHLSSLKDMLASSTKNEVATVTRVADTSAGASGLLPTNLEKDLKDLQQSLDKTRQQIADLQKNCNSGLYDLELSRRSLVENPYKLLTAGSGLALLSKSQGLGSIPLTGFAALQGYDDFKNLRDQTTFAGRGKYTLGLLADTAIGAGSLGFLTESVPMKYKAPLLIGGMVVRAAVDFIPNKK